MRIGEVKDQMAQLLKLAPEALADDALLTDLVSESFLLVDVVMDLQDSLGILLATDDLRGLRTVGDLARLLETRAQNSAGTSSTDP